MYFTYYILNIYFWVLTFDFGLQIIVRRCCCCPCCPQRLPHRRNNRHCPNSHRVIWPKEVLAHGSTHNSNRTLVATASCRLETVLTEATVGSSPGGTTVGINIMEPITKGTTTTRELGLTYSSSPRTSSRPCTPTSNSGSNSSRTINSSSNSLTPNFNSRTSSCRHRRRRPLALLLFRQWWRRCNHVTGHTTTSQGLAMSTRVRIWVGSQATESTSSAAKTRGVPRTSLSSTTPPRRTTFATRQLALRVQYWPRAYKSLRCDGTRT